MKSKLVLWGSNQNDEKLLVALELVAKENEVLIYIFSEDTVTELFYNRMLNEWRLDKPLDFPEGFKTLKRPLAASENILPEEIKVEKTDLISRAKSEWHFIVLSAKLYQIYHSELEDIKAKIDQLTSFDAGLWEEMKGFWTKVQKQMQEKNLFREHVIELRNKTNQLFDALKSQRRTLDEDFKKVSQETAKAFYLKLEEINANVAEGRGLQPLFEKLKILQKEFKDANLTRKDRSKVWKILDQAFKKIKDKKFGGHTGGLSNKDRIQKRYDGLISAIKKMERSIDRDYADKKFQDMRIETTDGQLEMQIRQAKITMIDERINSKKIKLDDMLKTKVELENRIEAENKREAKRAEKNQIKQVAKDIKEKIAVKIDEAVKAREGDDEKLKKAAEDIQGKKGDNIVEAVTATITEATEDLVDTVKAVAEVVQEKIEEIVEEIKGDEEE